MAAPTPTVRQVPSGFKMPDGYQSELTFALQPAVQFWEKTVKPPMFDGGDKIDTTTMLNSAWRTSDHRHLKTMGDITMTAMFDPDVISVVFGMINTSDTVTVKFPDNSTIAAYGFLKSFEIQELKEGEPPLATITVCITNWDPVAGVEAGPVFTAAAGT